MPIYEFVCEQCQGLMELLVKNREEQIDLRCPDCGSRELQRVVSRVNSVVAEGSPQGGVAAPSVENRSCPSGTCSTVTLPGHSRSS